VSDIPTVAHATAPARGARGNPPGARILVDVAGPNVTIVTPTFNAARFVRRCVESVLAQTFTDWELVVADDGSSDGTPEVAASYGDPRIRVLRLPHRGLRALAETYNHALRAGSGELVAVLEGDDWWPPDKLAVQVRGFDRPAVQLSWGVGLEVDLEGRTLKTERLLPAGSGDQVFTTAEIFQRVLREWILSPSITVMARRSALEGAGCFRQDGSAHYVDLPTWLTLLARAPGEVVWHDHVVGYWQRHAAQTTSRHGHRMRRERWRVIREVVSRLDPATLSAVGWTEALAAANRAEWLIGLGRATLRAGRFDRARRLHLAALGDGPGLRYRSKGLSGLLSSCLHVDLPTAWRRLRGRE
jgi:glycosyltransferase involved in cell wall biosynthesis